MTNKQIGAATVVATALMVGAYAMGRFTAPDRVVEKEVVRTVTKEDTTAKMQVVELTKQLETMKRQTHKETTVKPDGTKTIVEDTRVDRTNDTRTDVDTKAEVHAVKAVETVREVEKLVERKRPDWRVGPLVGFDVRTHAISYGATIERRILGPVSLGAWGTSAGIGGALVTLEF